MGRTQKHKQKYHEIDQTLFLASTGNISSMSVTFQKMEKAAAAIAIHNMNANLVEHIDIVQDLYRTSKKYHAPRHLMVSAMQLYLHYSHKHYDRKKALKYRTTYENAQKAFQLEEEAFLVTGQYYLNLRSAHYKKWCIPQLQDDWSRLSHHIHQIESIKFHRITYMLGCILYQALVDYQKLHDVATDAIAYFESYPLKSQPILSIFYKHKMNSLMGLNKFPAAIKSLEKVGSLVTKNSADWFAYKYDEIRLKLIADPYAQIDFNQIKKHPKFKHTAELNRTALSIAEAYYISMCYLSNAKSFKSKPNVLKSLEFITDDKLPFLQTKIQFKIVQILQLIINRNWRSLESRTSAIEKFISRYKLNTQAKRSAIFLKLVCLISKHNHHPVAIERHAKRQLLKLKHSPVTGEGIHRTEVINYEVLWDLVMGYLRKE